MAINTEMVGQTFGPFVRDYTFRDLELFALGCGAGIDGKDGLEYLNEHDERDPQLKVLPMFGAMLIVDSEVTRTIDYGYNYAGSLHWGFDIRFHQPITKMAGGWGGPKPPKDIVEMPERDADVEVVETIPENQALIYRLSGDYHPQHIDWDYAAENGEPRPILHAISYAGVVMRHAINAFVPGEPERITRFKTRITSPVHPGTTLKTKLWKVAEGELRFMLVDADADETGAKPHLNWGIIEYR